MRDNTSHDRKVFRALIATYYRYAVIHANRDPALRGGFHPGD